MQAEHATFAADVARGLVAGAVATWAMEKVTAFVWKHEDEEARNRYEEVTGGRYPPMRMAERADDLLRIGLSKEKRPHLAHGLHWAYGLGAGSAYSVLRDRVPGATAGRGLLFGALFSLVGDELLTSVTGLAEPPCAYPWQAHARGLVGHLAFGVVADATLHILDRAS